MTDLVVTRNYAYGISYYIYHNFNLTMLFSNITMERIKTGISIHGIADYIYNNFNLTIMSFNITMNNVEANDVLGISY